MAVPSDQHGADIACRVIFFIEIAINFITIPQCFLTPEKFLAMFIPTNAAEPSQAEDESAPNPTLHLSPVAKGFVPWYGVLLTVMSYGKRIF